MKQHSLPRICLTALAVLAALTACNHGLSTSTVSNEGEVPLQEGSEVGYTYEYSVSYLTGGLPQEVIDRVNGAIIRDHILFTDEITTSDVREACKDWEETSINGYLGDAGEMLDEFDAEDSFMFAWDSKLRGYFLPYQKQRKLLTYCCESSEYMGGAHGLYAESYTVFDTRTGEVVTEEDLFGPGYDEEALKELMEDALLGNSDYQDEEDWDPADAFFGAPYPNGNFSVDADGITWYFNPYDIAPYALGVIAVPLSWKQLAPFLK